MQCKKNFLKRMERAAKGDENRRHSDSGMANIMVCCRSHNPHRI